MSEIIKGRLFLGSVDDATNELWIKNNSIKLIISVMNEPKEYLSQIHHISIINNIEHYVIPISDMPTENIFANIHALCNKINSYETTLIHCMFGISRSATITIAYIMLNNKMYLDEATKLILTNRPFIFPNDGFIIKLIQLEKDIYKIMTYLPTSDGISKFKRLLHGLDK